MNAEQERVFRSELEGTGEAAVRSEYYSGGGLSTGGEDRRKIIRQWLREQEKSRQNREKMSLRLGQRTFWIALGALIASVAGVIATIVHK